MNGHQHSLSTRGINTVLFDYRSGIYEHRSSYDVYSSSAERTSLANALNGLPSGKILFMAARDAVEFDASSALALQRYGVSAAFANTNLPKPQCSMAAIAYTGGERKEWEQSVNKVGETGPSIIETTIYLLRELNGKDDCSQEMGIQARRIPDSAFTAESTWANDENHKPYRAKLHDQSHPGWCSVANAPVSEYLQVDLGSVKAIAGLAIQGHGTGNGKDYITGFTIDYSADGSNWLAYKDIDGTNAKIFDGIQRLEKTETRVNWFNRTMIRYFRIVPTARVSTITCLRIELYGCTPQIPIFEFDDKKNEPLETLAFGKNSLTVHYTIPMKSKATIEMSTAADNETLDINIDQLHFRNINASITHDYGTNQSIATMTTTTTTTTTNPLNKIDSSASADFNIDQSHYYSFNVDYNYQVQFHFLCNMTIKLYCKSGVSNSFWPRVQIGSNMTSGWPCTLMESERVY